MQRAPAGRLQQRHLSQAFEAWCAFLEGRREAQDRAQAALQHWTLGRVASSWQAWRAFVAAKHTKEVSCPVGGMQPLQLTWVDALPHVRLLGSEISPVTKQIARPYCCS